MGKGFVEIDREIDGERQKKYPDKMIVLRRIYTLFFVLMGWVLFRADSITDAWAYICTMFGNGTLINDSTIYYAMNYFVYFLIAILVSTPIFKNFSLAKLHL